MNTHTFYFYEHFRKTETASLRIDENHNYLAID
jgi:hypothetical protein